MTIDPAPIGSATAKLMDSLEDAYGDEAEVVGALVVAEVNYTDEDGEHCTAYRWQTSHTSPALTAGIAMMVLTGMME